MPKLLPTIICLIAFSYGCRGCDRQGLVDTTDADPSAEHASDADSSDAAAHADFALPDAGAMSDAEGEDAWSDDGTDDAQIVDAGTDAGNDPDTQPGSVCGNGDIEADEVCDDGNDQGGDYCAADCSAATGSCGDGALQSNEACDDGVTTSCADTRDGGDGACVAAGTCSAGFIDDGAACAPELLQQHVHIYVANDCSMTVDPPELNVRRGQKVQFAWHNHSQFYPVDVWQSYIGGYTDLPTGATWNEQFEWCANVNPYVGYSDITTNQACPSHRFIITCNGR